MNTTTIEIKTKPTRTESLVTFSLNKELIPPGTGLSFPEKNSGQAHPIAKALFEINGVESVWILGNDIQVTKSDQVRWSSIKSKIVDAIQRIA